MAARAPVSAGSRLFERVRKWYYNAQGFNKYGLRRDDILNETDVVKEAIKRLPEDVYYERIFRIKRAAQLSLTHEILPKDQWTKYEEMKEQKIYFISWSCWR
ncbi:PREDICTED: cytochrome b-c1 complex subunit 7 isoform X2 [Thamnophis sirtalis]|uniref:Cytochrome b-c1 complex subunit 7 n=1 Tax=Thamnophis sirtalis TaxID=35019 RepID=A0A6I9XM45_9SAUR|nr:PREDICTED: cytochrome b-c1 complex subunit 7 isoform X2 [Thamnophis sirtalis]